jgi:hypothetical protein
MLPQSTGKQVMLTIDTYGAPTIDRGSIVITNGSGSATACPTVLG